MLFKCLGTFLVLLGLAHCSPIDTPLSPEDEARLARAEEMLKYMDTSADPCDNFYEYTCGNFKNYHAASDEDTPATGPLELLDEAMSNKTIEELEMDNAADNEWDKQVKNFFRSCIAAPDKIQEYPAKLKEFMEEFGHMPVLAGDSWKAEDFDWLEVVAKIGRTTTEHAVLGVYIVPDFMDNSKTAGVFTSGRLSLEKKSFYTDGFMIKIQSAFINRIAKNMHKFLGIDMAVANETAKEIFELEVELAQGFSDDKDSQQLLEKYIAMDIEDVQKEYLQFWDTKKLFISELGHAPSQVYVEQKYMQQLKEVLNHTPKRILANYIYYMYAELFFYPDKEQKGKVNLEETKQSCFALTKKYFYKALDNLMYRRHFTEDMKKGVYFLWQDIKETFEEIIDSPRLAWMHPETRQHALEKLQHMDIQINSYEDVDFAEEYKGLDVKDTHFADNMKNVLRMLGDIARYEADLPPQPFDAGHESTFTPLYITVMNKVFVPVSFLMPYHFWSTSYPNAYNFAGLGFYLAHELVHGFDDDGRMFDEAGNSRNWWDTQSVDEFLERKKCFVKQYSKYINNEQEAQGENIADNGGLRLAFDAYIRWYTKAMEKNLSLDMESLPGLDYNHRQLFFISYGQTWCYDVGPVFSLVQSMTDTHMPDEYRVIGPLSNYEEFHKEFNCPKGSKMNPEVTCQIY